MHATIDFNGVFSAWPTLFDNLQIPAGVDRQKLIEYLLMDTLELEVTCPSGPILQRQLTVYSAAMLPSWQKAADALLLQYEALATDDYLDAIQGTDTTTRSPDLTISGKNTGEDSTTRSVTGFDSSQLQTSEKNVTQLGSGSETHTSGTEQLDQNYTETHRITGRRGAPAQGIINRELEIARQNINKIIATDIRNRFCILVY